MVTFARWALRAAMGILAVIVVYATVTIVGVWWASGRDDRTPADAIVVMGAAQWDGRPSPVLKARLDHAVELFGQGVAPTIVVTGGKQVGDRVTQGFAGYEYLMQQGIPESAIRIEVGGTNSYEELAASSAILAESGTDPKVVLVSDPYHSLRITEIAEEVGLDAHVSPTRTGAPVRSYLREAVAVGLGRLIGYRRLANMS